ncbi:hypothetical protein LS78_011200, partial [Helicobacter bilis]
MSNVLGEMQSKNNIVSINADEALQRLYSIQGAKIPQELDIKSFMNTLDSIVNKDNFIAHLQKKNDSQNRLAYLNLVEPTLNKWDLKLTSGDRTDLIKVFNDEKNFFTLLITAENNKRLITFLPKAREDYIASKIKNADHIQTFISRASKENEWTRNANPTTKQEISKDIESKSTQEIVKQVKQSGKSVRERQELIDKNNSQNRIYQKVEKSQTPKEMQDSTTQTIDNFKKEFNIHDEAFKPTGHIRDTKTGELEVLDTLNEYRPILNKNTYKKDGYYVISNHHDDLELLDFNGFNLGKVYHKKYDGKHRLFSIQDLELLENVSKDFLLLNGNKTLEQAKKLAQSKTKKGVYIDYFNGMQDPIKSINKATTKDGVEIYTLNTQKFKQKEPLTNLTADSKQLSQRTSQETKEIMLNHILENDKLLYLLKQGINTQHLSPFQKEILESALDIANNPTKLKEYKLQGLQKQLNNLNESEAYLKTLGNYDKAIYAKD